MQYKFKTLSLDKYFMTQNAMTQVSYAQWQAKAKEINFITQAFINGQFTDSMSGETFVAISPRDNQPLCQISACDQQDVELAVSHAKQAFSSGVWSQISPRQRKKVLLKLAQLMSEHQETLALLDTLDMGMTISDSHQWNVPGAIECVQWYAELADKLYAEVAPIDNQDAMARIHKVPVGVVAAITPWNYPLLIACWKIAPALAVGNSVILKPAEQSSLSALYLAKLAQQAGIPDGVFNVVPGLGEKAGKALGLHMQVDAIAFTGSTAVGKLYMQYAGQSNLKRVSLECGGKTPNIVLADVENIEACAEAIAQAAFANQGQICNAGSRLIVDKRIKQTLLERVAHHAQSYQAKDPLDPSAKIGCLVNEQHAARVQNTIQQAKAEQASSSRLYWQQESSDNATQVAACIFDQVSGDDSLAQQEIFGPVLSVIEVDNIEQAISVANGTQYALGAGVWTASQKTFERAAKQIIAGVVWHNCHDYGDISSPVGGFKQSGFGRDKSIHALDKYLEYKTIWYNLAD